MIEFEPVVEDVVYKIDIGETEHLLSPAWDTIHVWHGLGHAALKEMGTDGNLTEIWMSDKNGLEMAKDLGLGVVARKSISESENDRRLTWLSGFSIDYLDFESDADDGAASET